MFWFGYIFNPLLQFQIIMGPHIGFFGLTNYELALLFNCSLYSLIYFFLSSFNFLKMTRFEFYIRLIFENMLFLIYETIDTKIVKKFFSTLFSGLILFLFVNNILGLLPYSFAITCQFEICYTTSMLYMIYITLCGCYYHGVFFLKLFFPSTAPLALLPILVIIELIAYISRAFSLALRLFANMTAGHILLKVFSGFVIILYSSVLLLFSSLTIVCLLWMIELVIVFVQSYVFVILFFLYYLDVIKLH
jgi:ATP synthase subunit 6